MDKPADSPQSPSIQQVVAAQFSGPLPPPDTLEHYDKIVPGSAERILTMAEEQAKHRRNIEAKVIRSDVINSRLGLVFGLAIGGGGLTAATVIALYGNPATGGVIGFTTITSMVIAFIYGSRVRMEERETRRRARPS